MTHKQAEHDIAAFLDGTLENDELAAFLEHIEQCEDCKEELTIQFIVGTGMKRLEDGNAFNLVAELDEQINMAKKRLRSSRRLKIFALILQVIVVLLAGCLLILALKVLR
ncbi:anti-sigma factor family protein [Butyrivibrio sp. NC3005]|uniref:anti-sigma factor family protein n=1 Tax=Butyrivibrio sp. NC3005 TaxID=1280685 RepID=UPI000405F35F|nr:zf-HC2 domain-containing protein [Butyrivibrio sp. NC3005]